MEFVYIVRGEKEKNDVGGTYDLGKRIREYRMILGLSQEQLAEKSGLSSVYVGKVERGESSPTIIVLQQICEGLDISLKEFFLMGEKKIPHDAVEECELLLSKMETTEQLMVLQIIHTFILLKDKK